MNVEKELEDMINKWSPLLHKGLKTQKNLLDVALTAYDPLFLKDVKGKEIHKSMNNPQIEEIVKGIKGDIIPMFEENNYDEGIKKAKEILKKIQRN